VLRESRFEKYTAKAKENEFKIPHEFKLIKV
jgi:hypothetical protein